MSKFAKLAFAFSPGSQEFAELLDRCRDPETVRTFRSIAAGKIARGQYASAARLIREVVTKPAFFVRDGGSFNFGRFLGDCGILLVEGGSLGNVSFDAMRVILGAIILGTIRYARNRRRPIPRVRLVIDEASNAALLNTFLVRALAETQKMGLDIDILVQAIDAGSSFITDGILQNCLRHEWFYCGNAAVAKAGAADLGNSEFAEQLMNLRVGERFVKEPRRVHRKYVKPLEDLWTLHGLAEQKAIRVLRDIRKRPEYQNPRNLRNAEDPLGATSIKPSSTAPESTPASSKTSPTSSPALRLRTGA